MQLNLGILTFWGTDNRDDDTVQRLCSLAEQEANIFVVDQQDPRPLTCPTMLAPQDVQSKCYALGERVSAQYCSNGKTNLLAWMSHRWNDTERSSPPTPIPGPE